MAAGAGGLELSSRQVAGPTIGILAILIGLVALRIALKDGR